MELGGKGAPGVGADGSARRELERLGGRGGDLCVREALAGGRARGEIRARARPLGANRAPGRLEQQQVSVGLSPSEELGSQSEWWGCLGR